MFSKIQMMFCGAVILAGPAIASEWVQLAGSNPGVGVYIDLDSLAKNGNYKKAWFKFSFKTSQAIPSNRNMSMGLRHIC